jgi:hypothetical protein
LLLQVCGGLRNDVVADVRVFGAVCGAEEDEEDQGWGVAGAAACPCHRMVMCADRLRACGAVRPGWGLEPS